MPKRLSAFLAGVLVLVPGGCGTAMNFMHGKGSTPTAREVYGGVTGDAQIAFHFAREAFHPEFWKDETPEQKLVQTVVGFPSHLGFAGLFLIDLPLSAVADTLTLPLTIPAGIDRAVGDFYAKRQTTPSAPEGERSPAGDQPPP
jgi:uncharacterized protein YceK